MKFGSELNRFPFFITFGIILSMYQQNENELAFPSFGNPVIYHMCLHGAEELKKKAV